jgi:hypothetical protein
LQGSIPIALSEQLESGTNSPRSPAAFPCPGVSWMSYASDVITDAVSVNHLSVIRHEPMTNEEQIELYEAQTRAADAKLASLAQQSEAAPGENWLDIMGQILIWTETKEVADIALWGLRGNWERGKQ